jgi:hypothetical protein
VLQRLPFQRHKRGYGKVDDQHQGCEAGEQTQREKTGADNFGKDAEDEGPAVADVEEIVKGIFIIAEMGDLAKAVVDHEQQAEGHAKDEGAKVEGAVGALSGEEFHVRLGFSSKIDICCYL